MPGFLVTNIVSSNPTRTSIKSSNGQSIYYISLATDGAYNPDRGIQMSEAWCTITNGAILNKPTLTSLTRPLSTWIEDQLTIGSDEYFGEFRGSFSGAHFDKARDEWTFYTNQLGDQPIYYFSSGMHFAVGSDLHEVRAMLNAIGIRSEPRESAVIAMLTYGFLLPGETMNDKINRLVPGQYIRRNPHGQLELASYYSISRPAPIEISLPEAAREVDRLFERAVRTTFEHDRINHRAHLADLSGGMDARMVSWVAHDLGFKPITNITYSQSGFYGLRYTERIASALGHHLLISLMDDAGFLFDAEDTIRENHSSALYSGITGGRRMLRALDWRQFGLEHTGQLGGAIIGSAYLASPELSETVRLGGLYSARFADRLPRSHLEHYEDQEIYLLNVRGLAGILSTHVTRQHYTQAVSPFLDLDLINFCLAIPPTLRHNNRLYREWVGKYRIAAGLIPNDKTGTSFMSGSIKTTISRARLAAPRRLAGAFSTRSRVSAKSSMNPFDYWYASTPGLRRYLAACMNDELRESRLDHSLRKLIQEQFSQGSTLEKTMAISALIGARMYN